MNKYLLPKFHLYSTSHQVTIPDPRGTKLLPQGFCSLCTPKYSFSRDFVRSAPKSAFFSRDFVRSAPKSAVFFFRDFVRSAPKSAVFPGILFVLHPTVLFFQGFCSLCTEKCCFFSGGFVRSAPKSAVFFSRCAP